MFICIFYMLYICCKIQIVLRKLCGNRNCAMYIIILFDFFLEFEIKITKLRLICLIQSSQGEPLKKKTDINSTASRRQNYRWRVDITKFSQLYFRAISIWDDISNFSDWCPRLCLFMRHIRITGDIYWA